MIIFPISFVFFDDLDATGLVTIVHSNDDEEVDSPCLTSFSRSESHDLKTYISEEIVAYDKYMKWFEFPSKLKGYYFYLQNLSKEF